MILIIAEKPSLARNIASSLHVTGKKNGYMEGGDYIITWVFGHLFSLADIEAYTPGAKKKGGWTFDNLPCFPETFHYQLRGDDDGVKRQFELIRSLCHRPDVTAIVNAGDADREGEIIVRTCVTQANVVGKPFLRLWLPDQTPQTICQAVEEMAPDGDYDNLANEGYARTYMDWLYGVNLTRYASILSGRLLRVGRVIVPIVKAIYDRDMAIRRFVPTKYYGVSSKTQVNGDELVLTSREEFDKDHLADAEALAQLYNTLETVVVDKKSKEDILPPGKLYSLSTLQNVLGKKYKMSMKDSLDTVQSLYEKGYLTYPRTNSEYLATAEKGKVKQILIGVEKQGYPVAFRDSKYIFDDSKIESHSALTPTYKFPSPSDLTPREKQVYATVLHRFVAVFCKEVCKVEKSELHLRTGDREEFVLKGTAILQPGWTKYDDYTKKDKFLPKLEIGDRVETAFMPQEKETTPPRHYTIETLNNYLKNPFKEEKSQASEGEDDREDYRAIFEGLELGTEATRTGIIDNARSSGYIDLQKDVYTILPEGEYLIETLETLGIVMDKYKTAEMGKALKRVYRGTMTVRESTALAEKEIGEIFSHKEDAIRASGLGNLGETVARCPLCGEDVVRESRFYRCKSEGCTFRVGTVICHKHISPAIVKEIAETGKTGILDGFLSKNNKPFSSALILKEGKVAFDMEESKEGEPLPGCKCPKCRKKMVYTRFGYACSVKKCGFSVGRTILKQKIDEQTVRALCETGVTPCLSGFVSQKSGKTFSAVLAFREGKAQIVPVGPEDPIPFHDTPLEKPQRKKKETQTPKKAAASKPLPPGSLGHCPLCGDPVVAGRQSFGCLGYTHGCMFRVPFTMEGHTLSKEEMEGLLKTGKTPVIRGLFSPKGEIYDGRLIWKDGAVIPQKETK